MTRGSCVPRLGFGTVRGLCECASRGRGYTEKPISQPFGLVVRGAPGSIVWRRYSSGQHECQRRSQLFLTRKTKSPIFRALCVAIARARRSIFTPGKNFCTRLTDLRGPPSIACWSSFEPCRVLTKVRPKNYEGGMQAKSLPRPSPINTAKGHRPNRSPAV